MRNSVSRTSGNAYSGFLSGKRFYYERGVGKIEKGLWGDIKATYFAITVGGKIDLICIFWTTKIDTRISEVKYCSNEQQGVHYA